jgi:thiol-disulfide isomerase/thioredoxin
MNRILIRLAPLTVWLAVFAGWGAAPPTRNSLIAAHDRDLVVLEGERLVAFNSSDFPRAPYTVVYFGAGWCPDCRRFSPALVEAYNRQSASERKFEVLLVSRDRSDEGMLKFMKAEKMPWPALAFDKIASARDLEALYSGHGIPCLTVIDATGAVLIQSQSDQDAREVLNRLEALPRSRPAPK